MSKHTCHAIGCKSYCKPQHLMCAHHWSMVPKSKQEAVHREYRKGQCNLNPMPSRQWLDAANCAIYSVRIKELRELVKNKNEELATLREKAGLLDWLNDFEHSFELEQCNSHANLDMDDLKNNNGYVRFRGRDLIEALRKAKEASE